jgi:hypothetical protein
MNILNLYHSQTGNTEKLALRIGHTAEALGHTVATLRAEKELDIDIISFDFVFAGSGVYQWLPGKPMLDFLRKSRKINAESGNIAPCSPKRPGKKAVIYCTYAGVHTGVSEAVPAVKFTGQLFDHLGFIIIDEWYFAGDFQPENMKRMNTGGRLGDINGRPDERDLAQLEQQVRAVLSV